ncbi:MAG: choice-of-anchor D domain-containing protein, partial [Bacteroidetes bacterium]|nr:choice-of-anchor D domain-containing protein [Bacteroidota bacterium]
MNFLSRITSFLLFVVLCSVIGHAQGTWVQQPTALPSAPTTFVQVGGLWGIAMTDTGTGFAAGYASVANGFSGVLRKTAGDPTWYVLPSSNFTNLPSSHTLWSAVTAIGTYAWVCGSNGRLYKTTNNGNTWAEARNGIIGTNTLYDIYFKNQNEGMAVGNNATMYYTSDGGANWVQQTLPATVSTSTALYGIHSAGSNWYVSGNANTIIRGTPATSATGWVDLTGNAPSIGGVEGLQFLDNAVGTVGGIGVFGSPLYRTTNSGASWTSIGTGLGGTNPYNGVFFFDANNGWVGNAANNIARTSDGGQNWSTATTTNLPGQTPANWLTRLDFPSNSIGYAAGGAPGTSSVGWILRHETPLLPDISQTPTSLDFGTLDCDSSMQKVFTIFNDGNADLTLSSITFSSPEFSTVGSVPNTVPAAGGVTFSIHWTPSVPGSMPANAGMTIESDDVNNTPYFVQFSGIWNIGTLALGDTYDFGTICLNDSADVSLMITVTGNYSPKIIAFEHVSGPAYVRMLTPDIGATVSGTTQFAFRADPTTVGSLSSVYRMITGNPLCPRQQHITFTTSVTNADLTLSPAIVDFGDVCIGEFKDQEITVTNSGSEAGVISSRQFV